MKLLHLNDPTLKSFDIENSGFFVHYHHAAVEENDPFFLIIKSGLFHP